LRYLLTWLLLAIAFTIKATMTPVTIYWTLTAGPADAAQDPARFLSAAELENLASFRFRKRRSEWLLGRWAAKALLRCLPGYRQLDPRQIEIGTASGGAPRVRLADGRRFPGALSISHRDGLAFCAAVLTEGLNLGADLEKVESRSEAFLADYLTPAEQAWVRRQPALQRAAAAALVWSAKEAVLKALEIGLGWDTRWVEVGGTDLFPGEGPAAWRPLQVSSAAREEHPWSAWWRRTGGHVMTLAAFGGYEEPNLVEIRDEGETG
jgi:4'-phosphopantetheinyl transferase